MSNILENRISTSFTTTEQTGLQAQHTAYSAIINPKMVTLTEDQLAKMVSIDVDNYVFVDDTITTCDAEGVAMLPPSIGSLVAEMIKDYTFYKQIDVEIAWHLAQIVLLQQTQRLAAYESYSVANKIYELFKSLAEAGVPGAQAKYDFLKARYKSNGAGRPADTK